MASLPVVHIIDDDDAVRDSLAIMLEIHGFAVATYGSAREFLEQRSEPAGGCVVTDLQMAETDGLELLRALRAVEPTLPVIIITARPNQAARARARGATALVEKPFEPEAFVALIRRVLIGA